MDTGYGGNPWFYGSLQGPPWGVHDYDELNSTGPLLPLLHQYMDIGTMYIRKKMKKESAA